MGVAAPSGWPSIVSGPVRGVRTTQRILFAGFSGCPARNGSRERKPAASGGWAIAYGAPSGLLCPPASSSHCGIAPWTTAVGPQPPAWATALAVALGLGVAADGDVSGGRAAPAAEHDMRASDTSVTTTHLTPSITAQVAGRFHQRSPPGGPCSSSSPPYGCAVRSRWGDRCAGAGARWRPARGVSVISTVVEPGGTVG